jgi:hypothetical protein
VLAESASLERAFRGLGRSDTKCSFVPPDGKVVPPMPINPPPIDHCDRLRVEAQFVFHGDILPKVFGRCSTIATRLRLPGPGGLAASFFRLRDRSGSPAPGAPDDDL